MVSASITSTARQTTSTLQDRDIEGVAVIALSAAGGVIVSQLVAEELAEFADISTDPNAGLTPLVVQVGSKLLVAGGFAFAGASLGGLGLVAAAFMAVGSLASAGADAVDYMLNSSPLSGSQVGGQARATATARQTATARPVDNTAEFRNRASAHGGTKRPDSGRGGFR